MESQRRNDFIKTIESQYQNFCKSRETTPTVKGFAEYLINRSLITDLTIKRFLVVDKYPAALGKFMYIKRVAVDFLEDSLGIPYSTIQVYIKRHIKDFKHQNRLIPKS
jgi:hypothetical protein